MKYSESSIITDIYTKEKGLRSFIVSGLGSKKAQSKVSCYRHLHIIDIVAYDKGDGKLARIKEQNLNYYYKNLSFDVVKSSIGLFALEVSRNAIKEAEPNKNLYKFIYDFLVGLDESTENVGMEPIKFMINLSEHIGITPINNKSEKLPYFDMLNGRYVAAHNDHTLSLEQSAIIYEIRNTENKIKLSKESRSEILDKLIMYYKIHIEQFQDLKSVEVLREIF